MENTSTYVSPVTGTAYEILHTTRFGWERWEVFLNETRVQFALTADGVADSVRFYEVGDGVWSSRFD